MRASAFTSTIWGLALVIEKVLDRAIEATRIGRQKRGEAEAEHE